MIKGSSEMVEYGLEMVDHHLIMQTGWVVVHDACG